MSANHDRKRDSESWRRRRDRRREQHAAGYRHDLLQVESGTTLHNPTDAAIVAAVEVSRPWRPTEDDLVACRARGMDASAGREYELIAVTVPPRSRLDLSAHGEIAAVLPWHTDDGDRLAQLQRGGYEVAG